MSKMIQIRHVPDDIHIILKMRALEQAMSLSDFVLRELKKIAEKPTLNQILQRIEQREEHHLSEDRLTAIQAERHTR